MKDINVFEEIVIRGAQYKLRGVVWCHNNHFTYVNVNFNKMLETLIFQRSYAQYLY